MYLYMYACIFIHACPWPPEYSSSPRVITQIVGFGFECRWHVGFCLKLTECVSVK